MSWCHLVTACGTPDFYSWVNALRIQRIRTAVNTRSLLLAVNKDDDENAQESETKYGTINYTK